MKKAILGSLIGLVLVSEFSFGKSVEQTICFSQEPSFKMEGRQYYRAVLGDNATLNGGKCQGRTLLQMNKLGWRLIQVVGGLDSAFGMLLEKVN